GSSPQELLAVLDPRRGLSRPVPWCGSDGCPTPGTSGTGRYSQLPALLTAQTARATSCYPLPGSSSPRRPITSSSCPPDGTRPAPFVRSASSAWAPLA